MRNVQCVDHSKAPRLPVFLHARMKPFQHPDKSLQMSYVVCDGERSTILERSQWSVGVRLCQVNQAPNLSRLRLRHVTANECIDQRGFPDSGGTFDQQRFEWSGRHALLSGLSHCDRKRRRRVNHQIPHSIHPMQQMQKDRHHKHRQQQPRPAHRGPRNQ